MIRSSMLGSVPGVIHGFGTRHHFVPPPPPEPGDVSELAPALAALGMPGAPVAMLDQVHGAEVHIAEPGERCWPVAAGDALVSTSPGLVIYVRVADCTPVLVAGPRGVAAIHAGWRGTVAGVVPRAVRRLMAHSGQAAAELRAAVGPSIGPCCYEVGPEVVRGLARHAAPERFLRARGAGQRPTVDVAAVVAAQLEALGIPFERLPGCTRCDQRFHSWRRDGTAAGRQAAFIALEPV
jgi:YfiH family protein